jgi:4-diphosphocytidyl-2-C-methyl-D-erythritol kinase
VTRAGCGGRAAVAARRVTLDKQLPVAAGIGGGRPTRPQSCARCGAPIRTGAEVDWAGIAAGLGADVPVCLVGATTWMTGIGDADAVARVADARRDLVNPLVPVPPTRLRRCSAGSARVR